MLIIAPTVCNAESPPLSPPPLCRTMHAPAELVCSPQYIDMNSYQLPEAIISVRLSEQKENIAFSKII